MTEHLAPNFTREEFACKCGCGFDAVDPKLVQGLQKLRDHLRRPVRVLSGCRCPSHNRAVGGALNSQHLSGLAADITVPRTPIREVCQVAMTIPEFHGFGLDEQRNVLHLDVRVELARWVYRDGKAVSGWPVDLVPAMGEPELG